MFVVESEVLVALEGQAALETAFSNRLHGVDAVDGFMGLEVWHDRKDGCRFVMVTRWDSRDSYRAYMRSPANRISHARVPKGEHAPRPGRYSEYELVGR
ncbi:MAG TPA: antibiotic biosynthesis monooxygenase [Candidatus Dormibacteraeota bacterium]|nr:antibiotic biosynthesis monooxygenase [Candidatus Dormibacteraeota bacterium]